MVLGGHCCVVCPPYSRVFCDWKERPRIGNDVGRSETARTVQEREKSKGRSRPDPWTNP